MRGKKTNRRPYNSTFKHISNDFFYLCLLDMGVSIRSNIDWMYVLL